jgi:hypothetical protein
VPVISRSSSQSIAFCTTGPCGSSRLSSRACSPRQVSQIGDEVRVVARRAERLVGHDRIRHGREDAAQSVVSVQPRHDEVERLLDGALAAALGEARLDRAQDPVERGEGGAQRGTGRIHGMGAVLRIFQEELAHVDALRVLGPRFQCHQDEQRYDNRARPVGHLFEVEGEPARQQRDLHRHDRNRAPRHLAEQGERDTGEHVAARGAAVRQHRLAGAAHVRGFRIVARQLEGVVGLDRGAQVEVAGVEQRPAAVIGLAVAQVVGDLRLHVLGELAVHGAQEVLQHDVFRGDRRVGLELENPVAVVPLAPFERLAAVQNQFVEIAIEVSLRRKTHSLPPSDPGLRT